MILAIAGPIAGFYFRSTEPANNSQLLIGSRAGFAVAPRDATLVRFTVGPASRASGIRPGDHIVAIYGLPLPPSMPVNEATLAAHADDPAYIAMGNLLFGGDNTEIPLTVRSSDGKVRDVTVTTGEQHIDGGARALGISPKLLSFIDLLHVLAYPFLLWAAWLLHRRNSTDVVSSILSLAVLLNIAAEQPSSVFLAQIGVPRGINVALYDLGNVLLLAGILLFPHGNLSLRRLGTILCLPVALLPPRHDLRNPLRPVHDHRRAVARSMAAQNRIGGPTATNPLGASGNKRLCGSPLHLDRLRLFEMVDLDASASNCSSKLLQASASRLLASSFSLAF